MNREIQKSRPCGFDKCSGDLMICNNLIADDILWSKSNKASVTILSIKLKLFDSKQEQLIKNGIDEADA